MKKRLAFTLLLLCLFFASIASAESVSYQEFTAKTTAEYIDLGNVPVKNMDTFISFLQQLPNIKKVDMFATKMYPSDIDQLAATFPDVEFGWTMYLADHQVRTDATAFSTLHNNRSTTHSEREFKYLKYCKNLMALDLGHNSIRDISFLYDLPHLRYLILACNNKLRDITPIGSLKELEYLELFKNDIHDISCLVNCPNLVDRNICFNRLEDWTPLHNLHNLERLWLYCSNNYSEDCPVDKQVIADIKQALPACYVNSTSYSTLGGWREHDRYYVVYHTFKSGEYFPFDQAEEIKRLYPNGIKL